MLIIVVNVGLLCMLVKDYDINVEELHKDYTDTNTFWCRMLLVYINVKVIQIVNTFFNC